MAPSAPKTGYCQKIFLRNFSKKLIFWGSRKVSLNSVSASYFWDPFWDPSNLVEAVRNEAGSTLLRVFEAFSVTHRQTSHQTNAHKLFRNRGCWLESALILRAHITNHHISHSRHPITHPHCIFSRTLRWIFITFIRRSPKPILSP